jgi:hypothetical protein
MNIKQLKENIKNLPDDMKVEIEKFILIGWWHYEFEWFIEPKMYIEGNKLTLSE